MVITINVSIFGIMLNSPTLTKGSPINNVTVVGDQGFCDNSNNASVIESVTMGEGGIKKFPKLRDVI
jgi:hypothetical protein